MGKLKAKVHRYFLHPNFCISCKQDFKTASVDLLKWVREDDNQGDSSTECVLRPFLRTKDTSAQGKCSLIKAPPVGSQNAKAIHLNEFKIHIVLGQIIQCQVQTVWIYICWQGRPLLGRHSFIPVSCAQLGSHHSLPKPMNFLVFGSRSADKKQSFTGPQGNRAPEDLNF